MRENQSLREVKYIKIRDYVRAWAAGVCVNALREHRERNKCVCVCSDACMRCLLSGVFVRGSGGATCASTVTSRTIRLHSQCKAGKHRCQEGVC